jgi:hypothetical protein
MVGQAAPAGSYVLKMRFKPGAVSRYQTVANVVTMIHVPAGQEPPTTNIKVNLVQQMTVAKALPGGGGEVATTTQSGQILMNDKPYGASPAGSVPITTTYSANGDILKISGLPLNQPGNNALFGGILGSGALNLQRVYLPGKPVRPGDTWNQTVTTPNLMFASKGSATTKFVKLEKVGRYQTARLRTEMKMPMKILLTMALAPTTNPKQAANTATGTLKLTFDSNFALEDGKVIRSAGSGGGTFSIAAIPPKTQPGKLGRSAPATPQAPLKVDLNIQIGNSLIE